MVFPRTKYCLHISSPFCLPNESGNYIFKQRLFCLFFRSTPEKFEVTLTTHDQPDPPLCRKDSVGKDNRLNRAAITIPLPIICQWDRLCNTINMVVVDRPSPEPKRRPVAAGSSYFSAHSLSCPPQYPWLSSATLDQGSERRRSR